MAKDIRSIKDIIMSRITVDPLTNCWNIDKVNVAGYGWIKDDFAHRMSYKCFKGVIPKGKLILHICNNKRCINPEHLYAGTRTDNLYDALYAGAYKGRRVLTKEERQQIKQLYKEGYSMRNIAKMFNSNHPQISRAIKEDSYAFG